MAGSDRLGIVSVDGSALIAFAPCSHWWLYQAQADPEQVQELARFDQGITCRACLVEWHAAIRAQEPGTTPHPI